MAENKKISANWGGRRKGSGAKEHCRRAPEHGLSG